jgi:hypothetical protein
MVCSDYGLVKKSKCDKVKEIHFVIEFISYGCGRRMKKDGWRKGLSIGVALSLVILVFLVLLPSGTAVKVSGGIP